jgi:hypothetical protein
MRAALNAVFGRLYARIGITGLAKHGIAPYRVIPRIMPKKVN